MFFCTFILHFYSATLSHLSLSLATFPAQLLRQADVSLIPGQVPSLASHKDKHHPQRERERDGERGRQLSDDLRK